MRDQKTLYARHVRVAVKLLFLALLVTLIVPTFWPPGINGMEAGGVEETVHGILDLVALVMTAMVAILVWHTLTTRHDARLLMLGSFFAVVAVLDASHLLSKAGLMGASPETLQTQAENFWLLARLWTGLALFFSALVSDRMQFGQGAKLLIWGGAFVILTLTLMILLGSEIALLPLIQFSPPWLPFTLDISFLVLPLLLLSAWIWFNRAREAGRIDILHLFVAAALIAMSEVFYVYPDGHENVGLLGELFELVGIAFIYQALVVNGIKAPFVQLDQLTKRLQATIDAIPDMIFELDGRGEILSYYSDTARSKLVMPPAAFLGRNYRDVLPPLVSTTVDQAVQDIKKEGFTTGRTYQLDVDGQETFFELSGSLLAGAHQEERYLILSRDITAAAIAKRELARSQRILRAALDYMPLGVAITREVGEPEFEYLNQNFARFFRTTPQSLIGKNDFWEVVFDDPEARKEMRNKVQESMDSGDVSQMIWSNIPISRKGEGTWYVTAQKVPVPEEGLYINLVEDVTKQLERDEELRIAATAFSSQEGIVITDADQRILRVNTSFEATTGFKQHELQGKTPAAFASDVHDQAFFEMMWDKINEQGSWQGEIWNRRKNGETYPQTVTISAVRNEEGEITHYVAGYIDISDIKLAEARISQLSYYDSLTSLPNRDRMYAYLHDLQLSLDQHSGHAAIIMVDLDHFKTINDTMGHDSGDELLLQVTERISPLITGQGKLFRYGGDEFIAVLSNLDADHEVAGSQAQAMADKILEVLSGSYLIRNQQYYSSCSLGVTVFDGKTEADSHELLKHVEIALYQSKSAGRNMASFFDPSLQSAVHERANMVAEIRMALERKEFELFYQAQHDIKGEVVGVEALVRWRHKDKGLIPPTDFILLAEESGLMVELGDQIIQMGLDQLKTWQTMPGFRHLKLSINLSVEQFYHEGFVESLETSIATQAVDATRLMLEFTETTLIHDLEIARRNILRLNKLGVRFAIDDFGTGYSSLNYLSELPLDQLKIDQSFVRHINDSPKDAAIVRAIIDMAHTLGLEVMAEGVETVEQRDYLHSQGCTLYQGFLFSRPTPAQSLNLQRRGAL